MQHIPRVLESERDRDTKQEEINVQFELNITFYFNDINLTIFWFYNIQFHSFYNILSTSIIMDIRICTTKMLIPKNNLKQTQREKKNVR